MGGTGARTVRRLVANVAFVTRQKANHNSFLSQLCDCQAVSLGKRQNEQIVTKHRQIARKHRQVNVVYIVAIVVVAVAVASRCLV